MKSNQQVLKECISEGSAVQLAAGYSEVPCTSSLRNVRREILEEGDLDLDPLKDLFLRSLGPLKNYVVSLDTAHFRTILLKDSQVKVFQHWHSTTKLRRAYLDATGNILRKLLLKSPQLLHHVLLIPVYAADDTSATLFNMAEMITESQTMLSIKFFLEFVKNSMEERTSVAAPLFHEIVTDKSFANIGAISMAFNSMTLTQYMKECWVIASNRSSKDQKNQIRRLTVIRLCSSHTCKTMRDLVNKEFAKKEIGYVVCTIIGQMFNIIELELLMKFCENFLMCLSSPFVGPKLAAAAADNKIILARAMGTQKLPEVFQSKLDEDGRIKHEPLNENLQHNAIYKNSEAYKRLSCFIDGATFDIDGTPNEFYNVKFATAFLKCHLSYILLWSNVMSGIRDPFAARANNGFIENSFNLKKRDARENKFNIGAFGKVKIGRYVSFMSDCVDIQSKKVLMAIPARAGNRRKKVVNTQEIDETEKTVEKAKEAYKKRNRDGPNRSLFFSGKSNHCRSSSQSTITGHTHHQEIPARRSTSMDSIQQE